MARRNQVEEKVEHKQYVDIHSNITIRVEPSPEMYENATKQDSDIPNRLKVIENHSKYGVIILAGKHTYPSEILEYPSVKALIAKGHMSVAEEKDDTSDAKAVQMKEDLSTIADEKADGLEKEEEKAESLEDLVKE